MPSTAPDAIGLPQTGVSWHQARAYGAWLSDRAGEPWRLPSDAEWPSAAAERGNSQGVGDMRSNVREWTADCVVTGRLNAMGVEPTRADFCGARAAQGRAIAPLWSTSCATPVPADAPQVCPPITWASG